MCIVEFNVLIHIRTYVCVRAGPPRSPRFARLARRPSVLWSSMFTFMFVLICAYVCVKGGRLARLARLASLGSLGARVSFGVHGDFLNQFRKSRDVYVVYCKCLV